MIRRCWAAAALHDVMEDCGVTFDALSERFGVRVAGLVCEESQRACGDPCLTWNARKLSAVKRICGGCRATKIIALSDKLSNMRAISRDFARRRRGHVPEISSARQASPRVVLSQLRSGIAGRTGRNRRRGANWIRWWNRCLTAWKASRRTTRRFRMETHARYEQIYEQKTRNRLTKFVISCIINDWFRDGLRSPKAAHAHVYHGGFCRFCFERG